MTAEHVETAAVLPGDPQPTPESSSDEPTFAFAAWKAELELMLQTEGEAVQNCVQSLQGEFDERSQFVRGDFAWRKQVTAFHDRLQDAVTTQLGVFSTNVSKHAAQVADSLAQTLAKSERDSLRAVQKQEQKGESALRRARAALSKEVERITRLEKCLRQEEARQAAAILAERERQLQAEHEERENHLQALLGDMRASNESLETLNTQLLDALRTSRSEIDQLRNTLVRSMARPKRRSSSALQADIKPDSAARSGDKSGKNSTVRGLDALPSTTNELLLVPTLRQSLSTATQTIGTLKTRIGELESAHKTDKQKLRELQLSLTLADNEKVKAAKLLGEARSTLIDNEKQLTEAADENARWHEKFEALEALSQGRERALADAQRLEDAAREQIVSLNAQIKRLTACEAQRQAFERAVASWRETRSQEATESGKDLENMVDTYLQFGYGDGDGMAMPVDHETHEETEKRLRYELERRFGEQLNLRVSYERRRVLERLERLCAAEAKDKQERNHRPRPSVTRVNYTESDFVRLKRLIKSAYDQLGICLGAWSETDLDGLHARLGALSSQIQVLEQRLDEAANRAECQRVHLVRAELAQQEKDLLLAELTARYRQLRAAQVAWSSQQEQQQDRQPVERKPLTVYGVQQTLHKPRMHSLMQLRPASASPCLASLDVEAQRLHRTIHRASLPSPSRLGSLVAVKDHDEHKHNKEREEGAEDHVRSVMKAELMSPHIENQLEDTVGTDGVSTNASSIKLHFADTCCLFSVRCWQFSTDDAIASSRV